MNAPALCSMTAEVRRHLRTVDQEERRLNAIERNAALLMLPEGGYCPFDPDNLREALGELDGEQLAVIASHVGKALNTKFSEDKDAHYQLIGLHIAGYLTAYWTKYAIRQAEGEIDDSGCPYCFGTGCPHCDPTH